MAQQKQSKRGKRPDERPARKRYWNNRVLERKKVRNIMRHTGLSEAAAKQLWIDARKGRRMKR